MQCRINCRPAEIKKIIKISYIYNIVLFGTTCLLSVGCCKALCISCKHWFNSGQYFRSRFESVNSLIFFFELLYNKVLFDAITDFSIFGALIAGNNVSIY